MEGHFHVWISPSSTVAECPSTQNWKSSPSSSPAQTASQTTVSSVDSRFEKVYSAPRSSSVELGGVSGGDLRRPLRPGVKRMAADHGVLREEADDCIQVSRVVGLKVGLDGCRRVGVIVVPPQPTRTNRATTAAIENERIIGQLPAGRSWSRSHVSNSTCTSSADFTATGSLDAARWSRNSVSNSARTSSADLIDRDWTEDCSRR